MDSPLSYSMCFLIVQGSLLGLAPLYLGRCTPGWWCSCCRLTAPSTRCSTPSPPSASERSVPHVAGHPTMYRYCRVPVIPYTHKCSELSSFFKECSTDLSRMDYRAPKILPYFQGSSPRHLPPPFNNSLRS